MCRIHTIALWFYSPIRFNWGNLHNNNYGGGQYCIFLSSVCVYMCVCLWVSRCVDWKIVFSRFCVAWHCMIGTMHEQVCQLVSQANTTDTGLLTMYDNVTCLSWSWPSVLYCLCGRVGGGPSWEWRGYRLGWTSSYWTTVSRVRTSKPSVRYFFSNYNRFMIMHSIIIIMYDIILKKKSTVIIIR